MVGWARVGSRWGAGWLVVLLFVGTTAARAADGTDPVSPGARAQQILQTTKVQGGLIVHLGCGDGKLTTALRASDAYLVQGLDADDRNVETARAQIRAAGLYGQVSADRCDGSRLPYIDNLVNLIVAEQPGQVSREELLRVLVPNGVAYVKTGTQWSTLVKPRPPAMDEWNQYLHGAGNNAVAHDAEVGPPRHMQWVAGPNWSRHHDHMASLSAMVSAGGRVFYIMDEGPREAILLPAKWFLIARDAFNGTILWKRAIEEWNTQLWPLKSGPNQLPRRLVAVGDRVYVTLGIDAPLVALDAATGKLLRTYAGTDHADEVIVSDGVLFVLVAHAPNKWKEYRPQHTYVWDNTRRANKEWAWDEAERSVVAIAADSGKVLWKQEHRVAPLTLAADAQRVCFYDGEKVVCLDRASGKQTWTSEPVVHKQPFPTGYGPTLVLEQNVVLLSVETKAMTAFAAADGKTLWTAPHHHGGHASPDDMLVINGLVWSGAVANGADSGTFTGRDIRTGEIKSEFPPDVNPDWFHHRCYRSRATDKFFLASRTGIEFIDLQSKHWDINHWVRGGCLYGFMPCNGLVYFPPHDCGCFLESKLFGLNALAAESACRHVPREVPDAGRLERGPAWEERGQGTGDRGQGKISQPRLGSSNPQSPIPDPSEWPTYRHDAARSGAVATSVPVDLRLSWQAELGGKLSSPVVAGDKVFVAARDAHSVHAIDAGSGKPAWSFTAGARVDSPPTVYQGRVLFGSADGWVYCLRAADGQLAWRFRAAPVDRRLMAYEQLESAWPVSGSVLVAGDTVYCVAGRSAFLDGGMRLVRLDAKTGRKLSETLIEDRDPATGKGLQSLIKAQDMPVALPDILSCDGRSVYMRTQAFDLEGKPRQLAPIKIAGPARRKAAAAAESEVAPEIADHLFSRSGFLDDSWFWRSYWMYGKGVDSNYGGWLRPGHLAPCGRLIVFDQACVYGFDRKPEYLCNASVQEYYLYGADRQVNPQGIERVQAATNRINDASTQSSASSSDWATRKKFPLTDQTPVDFKWAAGNPPIQAHALALAGKLLLLAGPPDVLDEEEAFRNPDDPAIRAKLKLQAAALAGQQGGQLLLVSAADGRTLNAVELGAMPTFDGMAVAKGKVYLTTSNGKVLCLGGEGKRLPKAQAALAKLDISVKPPPVVPSLNGEFSEVSQVKVTQAELGYRVSSGEKQTGFALRQLPAPLAGKVKLTARMHMTSAGNLKNGFLVFGDRPEEAHLVKCGLRVAMKKVMIVAGPLSGGKVTDKACEPDESKTYDVTVTVDLASGKVTLQMAGTTVTATLDPPPANIAYVGYLTTNAATDFSAIEAANE